MPWGAAIGGGIVGAVLTGGALILAGPSLVGDKLVRDALLANLTDQALFNPNSALSKTLVVRQLVPALAVQEAAGESQAHSPWTSGASHGP